MSRRTICALALVCTSPLGHVAPRTIGAQSAPAPTTHARRVPLEGAANFRDLGGYSAQGGRHVKWGLVYRSDHLASLTASDYQHLHALDIKLVCDLRSDGERKRAPMMWQGNPKPEILSAPIVKDTGGMLTSERLKQLSAPGSRTLADSYVRMIAEGSEQYGVVLRRLAYGPLPAVTHCSAGKDRTGVFGAILLTILGVPHQVVVEDYLLTGQYMLAAEPLRRVQMDWQKVSGISEPPSMDMLRAAYTMTDAPLVATFDAINRLHGSFEMFARNGLKLTAEDIAALRARLLE